MASIEILNLDDELGKRLGERPSANGRSVEEEARVILHEALGPSLGPEHPVKVFRALVEHSGGVDLELPPREPARNRPASTEA